MFWYNFSLFNIGPVELDSCRPIIAKVEQLLAFVPRSCLVEPQNTSIPRKWCKAPKSFSDKELWCSDYDQCVSCDPCSSDDSAQSLISISKAAMILYAHKNLSPKLVTSRMRIVPKLENKLENLNNNSQACLLGQLVSSKVSYHSTSRQVMKATPHFSLHAFLFSILPVAVSCDWLVL